MSVPRLISAPINLVFSLVEDNDAEFEREYHTMSESDDDPIGQWLKLAKAKGETSDSDPVLLNLMVELHRKIDALEKHIKDEVTQRVALHAKENIFQIGFSYFELDKEALIKDQRYYGRVSMPTYPQRDVGIYFVAQSTTLAKIDKMHERDIRDWSSYVTARERVMIREMKQL